MATVFVGRRLLSAFGTPATALAVAASAAGSHTLKPDGGA